MGMEEESRSPCLATINFHKLFIVCTGLFSGIPNTTEAVSLFNKVEVNTSIQLPVDPKISFSLRKKELAQILSEKVHLSGNCTLVCPVLSVKNLN